MKFGKYFVQINKQINPWGTVLIASQHSSPTQEIPRIL
jgi:hypothetical protein